MKGRGGRNLKYAELAVYQLLSVEVHCVGVAKNLLARQKRVRNNACQLADGRRALELRLAILDLFGVEKEVVLAGVYRQEQT